MAGGGDWSLGLLKYQNLRGKYHIEKRTTEKKDLDQFHYKPFNTKYKVAAKRQEKLSTALIRLHVRVKNNYVFFMIVRQ